MARRDRVPRKPGVVMQISGRRAVVLADGSFVRTAAPRGCCVGDEVWVRVRGPMAHGVRQGLAAFAAACGAAGAVVAAAAISASQPSSVVSVDLNPSVQLSVDRGGVVVGSRAMDAGGARILASMPSLRHVALPQAVADVVNRAAALGYLSPRAPGAGSVSESGQTAPAGLLSAPPPTSSTTTGIRQFGILPSLTVGGGVGIGVVGTQPAVGTQARPSRETAPAVLVAGAPTRGWGGPSARLLRALGDVRGRVAAVLARDGLRATVAVAAGTAQDARAASAEGLTVGEYLLVQSLSADGLQVPPQAFGTGSLTSVLASAGVPRRAAPAVIEAAGRGPAAVRAVLIAARQGASADQLMALAGGTQTRGHAVP